MNEKTFGKIKDFRYQFVLGTDDSLYYLARGKQVHFTHESFLANNERTGRLEIVNYRDVNFVIKDGVRTECSHRNKPSLFRKLISIFI